MTKSRREILMELTKEQLIYLLEQFERSLFMIGETCVDESKWHISSEKAVEEIRRYIFTIPGFYDIDELRAYIDMKMEKISIEEYRKIIGLD